MKIMIFKILTIFINFQIFDTAVDFYVPQNNRVEIHTPMGYIHTDHI